MSQALAALLRVAVLQHVVLDKVHHLLGGVHIEEAVAAQQQELVLVCYRQHLLSQEEKRRREKVSCGLIDDMQK